MHKNIILISILHEGTESFEILMEMHDKQETFVDRLTS